MNKNICAVIITIIIGITVELCNNKSDIATTVKDTNKIGGDIYKDCRYEGIGKGYDGDIKVMFTVSKEKINDINIID